MQLPTIMARELLGHQGSIFAVRFNRTGSYCVTGGSDKTVRLWNPHKGTCIKTYTGHGWDVFDLAVAGDNSWIVSGSGDKSLIQWDVTSGNQLRKLRGHVAKINCVQLNEESTVVVSGSYDATVRMWDLRSHLRDPIQILNEAKDSVSSIHVLGHQILTGSVDGCVRVYDVRAGRLCCDNLGVPVTSVRFSHDSNCILASLLDNSVRLLDQDSGKLLASYGGHVSKDYKIDSCFSNNDALVLSGSEDGRLCIWDLVQGSLVSAIAAHKTALCSLAYHPSQDCVLTSSTNGSVKVWKSQALVDAEQEDGDREEASG